MYRTYIYIEVVDNAIIDGQSHREKKTKHGYLALGSLRSVMYGFLPITLDLCVFLTHSSVAELTDTKDY